MAGEHHEYGDTAVDVQPEVALHSHDALQHPSLRTCAALNHSAENTLSERNNQLHCQPRQTTVSYGGKRLATVPPRPLPQSATQGESRKRLHMPGASRHVVTSPRARRRHSANPARIARYLRTACSDGWLSCWRSPSRRLQTVIWSCQTS